MLLSRSLRLNRENVIVFKRIALIAGVDGVLKALGFLLIPIYLLWMPKKEFGEFGYLLSTLGMLPPILTLGLYVPQIRESSSSVDYEYKKKIFSTTFLTVSILTCSVFLILSISGFYVELLKTVFSISNNFEYKWLGFSVATLFSVLNLLLYSHALHFQQTNTIVKYNSLRFFASNIFSLSVLYFGLGYADTTLDRLIGVAIGEMVLCAVSFFWLAKDYWCWKIDFSYLKNALKVGLPIIPGSIAALISSMSDRYFLSKYFDATYVAEYNLALQFLMPLQMIMTGAQTVWAPHVFSVKDDDDARYKSFKFLLQLLMAFIAVVPMLVLLVFFAKFINVIPPNYHDTLWLVPMTSFGVIGLVLLNIPFNLFIRAGKSSWVAHFSIMGAILIVIGDAFVIPKFGYFGGALVSGLVNALLLALAWRGVVQLSARK
jgi:O-antigen/teichoic acid export membrane protein